MEWDAKASHPWMMIIELKYKAVNNGMPDQKTFTLMDQFEGELSQHLPDSEGHLNLGRKTYNGSRNIYFACKEFRVASKTVAMLTSKYLGKLEISYDIFKDKYWMTMDQFIQT